MERTRPDSDWMRDLSVMAGDVFYVMRTAPDQALEFMSEGVQDVLGHSAQEIHEGGLEFMMSLADPRDAEELLKAMAIAPGERHYLEMRWLHPTGRKVVTQHWMRKVRRPDGSEVIEGNTREVTTLRRLESDLRESENRFRNAMEHAAIGMCLVSPAGHFLAVNQALCDLLARDEQTLLHTTWQTLTHPGDLHTDVTLVDDVLSGRQDSYRLLKRYLRPDGTVVWGDISVSCVRDDDNRALYLVVQIVDVSAQMEVEQALRESEEQYRMLAEESSDFIVRSDGDDRIVSVSPSVSRVIGWDPEDLIGSSGLDFVHPEDLPNMRHGRYMIERGLPTNGRNRIRCADGEYKWMQVVARRLASADGSMIGIIGSFRDIDAQVRAENAAAESEAIARAERARLRAIMDAGLDPHFLLTPIRDEQGSVIDFLHVDTNHAGLALTGVGREALIGSTVLEMQPDAHELVQRCAEVLATGIPLVADAMPFRAPSAPEQTRLFDVRAVRVGEDVSVTTRDVTQREQAAQVLTESQERYRLLAENATDVIFRLDIHGVVEWVSDGIARILGGSPQSYLGRDIINLVDPADRESGLAAFEQARDGLRSSLRLRLLDSTGRPRWIDATLRVVSGADGVLHFVGGCRDVQAEMEALAELDRRARTDHLTGLLNRDEALNRLQMLLSGDRSGPFAVAFCDVDAFKSVNDSLGHAAGDALLVEAAARIRSAVRDGDLVARVGGDEIVVILPGVHTLTNAIRIGEKLRACLHEPVSTDAGAVHSTLSIGITLALPGEDADEVMSRADAAMYRAKQGGRDRVVGA